MAHMTSLPDQIHSGQPLNNTALGHHLAGIDRTVAAQIPAGPGLAPEGSTYPWRRIWRQVHGIEGSHLTAYLGRLKLQHPDSVILGSITDLEAELRAPCLKFPGMATMLGTLPDTLRKQIERGDRTLPFPVIARGCGSTGRSRSGSGATRRSCSTCPKRCNAPIRSRRNPRTRLRPGPRLS